MREWAVKYQGTVCLYSASYFVEDKLIESMLHWFDDSREAIKFVEQDFKEWFDSDTFWVAGFATTCRGFPSKIKKNPYSLTRCDTLVVGQRTAPPNICSIRRKLNG